MYQNYLEGELKHRLLGSAPGVSDSVELEWGLRICIPIGYLGMLMLVQGPHSENY